MSRLRAETMPAVTVPPSPNGLPIAITHSPKRSFSESPNCTALSGLAGFTRSSAMSVLVSRPTISACSLSPLLNTTVISSASAMTWLLVTTRPLSSMTKPEPSELARRGPRSRPGGPDWPRRFLKNSSKNSSNGEPGCACGPELEPDWVSIFCEVEILTTASMTFSATSVMPSGPRAAAGASESGTASAIRVAAVRRGRRAQTAIVPKRPAMNVTSPNQGMAPHLRRDRLQPANAKPGGCGRRRATGAS